MSLLIHYKFVAERKGFEPSIRLWRIHTFQACAFDHSATSLYYLPLFEMECQISKKKQRHKII